MLIRLVQTSLPVMLAGAVAFQPARADVYTWVDKSGSINVSNLAPPEGMHVTHVVHATPEATAAREAAARESSHQAEVQALADRVRQLESEVQTASRPAPPQAEYRPLPAGPPLIQYIGDPAAAAMQYAAYAAPSATYGCDPAGIECGGWGYSGFYPPSIVVLRAANFRRSPPFRDPHHVAVHQSMHPPAAPRRG